MPNLFFSRLWHVLHQHLVLIPPPLDNAEAATARHVSQLLNVVSAERAFRAVLARLLENALGAHIRLRMLSLTAETCDLRFVREGIPTNDTFEGVLFIRHDRVFSTAVFANEFAIGWPMKAGAVGMEVALALITCHEVPGFIALNAEFIQV